MRRILPRSFLGRSLLIILIPLLVTQGISLALYYGNYLDTVSRRITDAIAGEVTVIAEEYEAHAPLPPNHPLLKAAQRIWLFHIEWLPHYKLTHTGSTHILGPLDEDLTKALSMGMTYPFFVDWADQKDKDKVQISVQLSKGVLYISLPRKRLDVGPIWLFVTWEIGSFLCLFFLAALFTRNQVRAIRRLAHAAEDFGLGRDPGPVRLQGAKEVRRLATAFNRMRDRILRFVAQRTSVLAGVSHDLRTPLTRIRLSLAMIPQHGTLEAEYLAADVTDMISDVEEMERMIEGYLSFARGEGSEQPQMTNIVQLVEDLLASASRAGALIQSVNIQQNIPEIFIRVGAIRRVISNIITNAHRHGGAIWLSMEKKGNNLELLIEDNGPGIPASEYETIFRAFESGERGGTGLGLTIARDIVRAHGGDVVLSKSTMGGLAVFISVPY